ncbi:MAG: hypothetical protein KDD22_02835, partial [Bdellovibrionales bacterium]|nr:hypothetical protein [Bdellovibrionales bacterium]
MDLMRYGACAMAEPITLPSRAIMQKPIKSLITLGLTLLTSILFLAELGCSGSSRTLGGGGLYCSTDQLQSLAPANNSQKISMKPAD